MRILCGYVDGSLQPEAAGALAEFAPDADLLDFTGDAQAYWRAMCERWNGNDDLVVIEQDNVITSEVLPSFAACGQPWCCFYYPIPRIVDVQVAEDEHGSTAWGDSFVNAVFADRDDMDRAGQTGIIINGLGCTKFSAELQLAVPHDTIAGAGQSWDNVDEMISKRLNQAGYGPHLHGMVRHLHADLRIRMWQEPGRPGFLWQYVGYPVIRHKTMAEAAKGIYV
jgi:hypothetical protein